MRAVALNKEAILVSKVVWYQRAADFAEMVVDCMDELEDGDTSVHGIIMREANELAKQFVRIAYSVARLDKEYVEKRAEDQGREVDHKAHEIFNLIELTYFPMGAWGWERFVEWNPDATSRAKNCSLKGKRRSQLSDTHQAMAMYLQDAREARGAAGP